MSDVSRPQATILWRRLDLPGHEICRLTSRARGWGVSGTSVFLFEQQPCGLDYRIECDEDWSTRSARVSGAIGDRLIRLNVSTVDGKWWLNDIECPAVEGCTDVDLGFSPSTNILPIRRLKLAVGDGAGVCAAWLPFPKLEFEVLQQLYTREEERTYRYESAGGVFKRTLEVNAEGLVTTYPGLWQAEPID